jgi:Uma2 family endonuclease
MAAPAQLPFVPLEEYLHSSYEPDAEYVDGVIEERPAGEWNHSSWQAAILDFYWRRSREWDIRVRLSLRIQVHSTRFRIPDVTVLDRNLPVEPVITHPPIAVFEVLSPEDSVTRMMTKLGDYEQMGIQTILVLDPDGKHFRFRAGALEPLTETIFDLPGSKCRFDLAEIFKLLDE